MYNYQEMRHLVTQRSYYWRKKIDNLLYRVFPNWWIPLYTMVSFTRIPYHQCMALRDRQDRILKILRMIGSSIVGLYLLKQFMLLVLKPFAIKFIIRKILPKIVADQVA